MHLTRVAAAAALLTALLLPVVASAHEAKGRNGGRIVDAGKYHAELLLDGTPKVSVFVSDSDDEPISAAGFKANAIFVVGGKAQRFTLAPADGARIVGTAPVAVPQGTKGVIQLTAPDGTTAQAKY